MTTNADAVLDVVKDGQKFKAKIEQLAAAEKASNDAADKAREAQKEMAAAVDAGREELAELNRKNQKAVENAMKPIDDANKELAAAKAAHQKERDDFEKAAERLSAGQSVLKAGREDLKRERGAFQERVDNFSKAIAAVVKSA